MKFAQKELTWGDTSMVCEILKVSRSTYYRVPKKRESEEIELENKVINCFKANCGNYGRIRIKRELRREKITVSENKIARILKEHGLVAKSGRKGTRKKKKPTEEQYIEENLIKNKFEVRIANYLWCSDITELKCKSGKLYICGIIDVATRRLVGWSVQRHQRQDIVHNAFMMAIGRNPHRPADAVYHSDRGCQYTAKMTKDLVESNGFKKSMSRPGTPSDNQPIESFWRTLECEMPDIRHLTFEAACMVIVKYFEFYYNSDRLHSGIDYHTPNEFFELLTL